MSLADARWERERQRAAAAGLLTTGQAARRMNVPTHMVKTWAQLGLITNHGAGGKGSVALWDYSELRTAPDRRVNLRARGVCSEIGCDRPHRARGYCDAHYRAHASELGVTITPTPSSSPNQNAESALRRGRPLGPPRTLPYRAIAKSCPDCGLLRTTPDEFLRRETGRLPACPRCRVRRVKASQRARAERDEEFRRKLRRRTDRNRARANRALADVAQNWGKGWTGPELEIVARDDLTARQAAMMLGRTMYAVKHMRQQLLSDPRKIRLASVRPDASTRVPRSPRPLTT